MAKGDEERERRLAVALRQNLRRRKTQARGEGSSAQDTGEASDKDG